MTALIVLNLVLAIVGAVINRLHTFFAGVSKDNWQAALGGVVGTLIINLILWLFFTTNAGPLLVLSITFPSFILGGGLAAIWESRLNKSGRR